MTSKYMDWAITEVAALLAEEGVDTTSTGLTAALRATLGSLIDKNRDKLGPCVDALRRWGESVTSELMAEWIEAEGASSVDNPDLESALVAASKQEYRNNMDAIAANMRPANIEEIAELCAVSLLVWRQSGPAVCVFHVSRSDCLPSQVDDWKAAALDWMPEGATRSDVEVFTGLEALKLVLRERFWSHIPSFANVAAASGDWLRLLARAWLTERRELERQRMERKAGASDLAASSRAMICGRDYQRLPKIIAGLSWALGGPGIEMPRIEVDRRIFVPVPDTAVSARQVCLQGEEPLAIVPAGYAALPAGCAKIPHQTILPVDLQGAEDSPPLALAVAAASQYVISAPAGKLGIRILAAAHASRNGLHKTTLRELAREINPGARLVFSHYESVARGLVQLDKLRLLLPNGWAYRVFDCALPPWRVLNPVDYDTVIYVGMSKSFDRNLADLQQRLGRSYRGEFLFDLSGAMALPTNRPGVLRQYVRATATWNAYWEHGTNGKPDIRKIPQVETARWAAMTNYLPPAAVGHMHGRNDGGARSSYSRAITAVLDDLEFLASREGGRLVNIDKANRKIVRVLPPTEYLEAKGKCTKEASTSGKGKAVGKERQKGRQK